MLRYKRVLRFLVAGFLTAGLLLGVSVYFRSQGSSLPASYLTTQVEQGAIERTVSSTGNLRPLTTVQVGSQVSGRILKLYADFNSVVEKGQTLALIDPAHFEAQRQKAEAALATAQASVKNAKATLLNREAELASARANLEVAQVALQEAASQLQRTEDLYRLQVIPKEELEKSQANFDQCRAKVQQAEALIRQAEAGIHSGLAQKEQAMANVQQAEAELQMAEVNLRYTKITSPIDGVVIERSVDIGQTVAAGLQAPTLFVIANDLSKMQVIAQIDEAEIGMIAESAKVEFTVDAFPAEAFEGKISEIRLGGTGSGASNVVVFDVIVDIDNPQLKLRPGMTATVTFTVARVEDVLKVANAALRYEPSIRPGRSGEARSTAGPEDTRSADSQMLEGVNRQALKEAAGEEPVEESSTNKEDNSLAAIWWSEDKQSGIAAGRKIHFPEAEGPETTWGMVWVLGESGRPERRQVQLSITDGKQTAVLEGELEEGEAVITAEINVEEAEGSLSLPFGNVRGSGTRGGTR